MKHRSLVVFLALLILAMLPAIPAQAQSAQATFMSAYDVAATSFIYCVQTGQNGNATDATPIRGFAPIITSGSSTTVTSATASTSAFRDVVVGDVLFIRQDPATTTTVRYVTARASADSITVDSAVNITAATLFSFRHQTCATAATSGQINAAWGAAANKAVELCITTLNATSISFSVEGKLHGDSPAWEPIVVPTYTAAGCETIPINEPLSLLRVGVKVNTDTGVQSVTAKFLAER